MMKKVIFLCTGNSCRSQMAEGFARRLGKGVIEPYSAGLNPVGINEKAVQVMREIGIDISQQTSKAIDVGLLMTMDTIVTLCDNAAGMCPWTPPGIKRVHWPIKDPATATGTEDEILSEFRRARDEIRGRVRELIKEFQSE